MPPKFNYRVVTARMDTSARRIRRMRALMLRHRRLAARRVALVWHWYQ